MGDMRRDHVETTEDQLRREAQELLSELHVTLNKLDRVKAGKHARRDTPEERRRRFYLIKGGAVGAALAWLGDAIRRPVVAAATGTTAGAASLGVVVVPGLVAADNPPYPPPPPPVTATYVEEQAVPQEYRPEPEVGATVVREPARDSTVETTRTVHVPMVEPQHSPGGVEVEPAPQPPQPQPEPEPEPAPVPVPVPEPTQIPAPSPTATFDVDLAQLCASVGLPPTAGLVACLARADKLGLEVGLGL